MLEGQSTSRYRGHDWSLAIVESRIYPRMPYAGHLNLFSELKSQMVLRCTSPKKPTSTHLIARASKKRLEIIVIQKVMIGIAVQK
eukprot:SAG31_NODE_24101_length_489_cov_0.892308_2_plen_85_part_00